MEYANETMAQGGTASGRWKPSSKPTRTKNKAPSEHESLLGAYCERRILVRMYNLS